jgi:hypothetical protein
MQHSLEGPSHGIFSVLNIGWEAQGEDSTMPALPLGVAKACRQKLYELVKYPPTPYWNRCMI